MEARWVDFKTVKERVTIQMVLDHYSVGGLTKSGNELRGKCPIHRGSNKKHFTASVNKNIFKCFFAQCGAHGNVLDLVAAMEQCSVREAALKLNDWFKVGEASSTYEGPPDEREMVHVKLGIYTDEDGNLFEVIANAHSGEDFEALVVYRELFGDYRFFAASPVNFGDEGSRFVLAKTL